MKILVVEVEKQLLQSIAGYLQKSGFVCEKAADYRTARQKITGFGYDIVLLDITLPDGSGLDLLTLLKQTCPKTGILILSAMDSLENRVAGLDLGADDYLTKPFHLAELNRDTSKRHIPPQHGFQSSISLCF